MRGLGRPYLPDHAPRRPAASGVTVYASAKSRLSAWVSLYERADP